MSVNLVLILMVVPWTLSSTNSPPRFGLDDDNNNSGGGDIIVRLKEGPATPPGTKILKLKGHDDDGDQITFGLWNGASSDDLLRIENQPSKNEASIYLNRVLDAESASEHQVLLTLTDGRLGEGNFITQSLLIIVEDVNDNAPVFLPHPSRITVDEEVPVHELPKVVATLHAIDRDSGIFGQVVYEIEETDDDSSSLFSIATTAEGKGVLSVVGTLDYETKNVHQLTILAKDRANFGRVNSANTAIVIEVKDVPDQPPEFVMVPAVTRVPEDIPKFSEVLRVRAIDGDHGVNSRIGYSLVSGPDDIFDINGDTGIVFTTSQLDRESSRFNNGAFVLGIMATEIDTRVDQRQSVTTATTEVTIIIEDVNDESPEFASDAYIGFVAENSGLGTPVSFRRGLPEVSDKDLGTNGTFILFIQGQGSNVFEVSPQRGINVASFSLRVKNESALDYETTKSYNFTLAAREVAPEGRMSTVPVTILIGDQNDNPPVFERNLYVVEVVEDVVAGTPISWIRATDTDDGRFGTEGIRFTRLSGAIATQLTLDPETGVISTRGHSPFDREKNDFHYLTVEARDNFGTGNRNSVELHIKVLDANDNPPVFRQEVFKTSIAENEAFFDTPFRIQADDLDQVDTDNAAVRYHIVGGDSSGNFSIDSVTGELRPNGVIDFETMNSVSGKERFFNLTVSAYDLGSPSLSNEVQVIIYVKDRNDHPPMFEKDFYSVEIDEEASGGTEVIQLKAFDEDGSAPNNEVLYMIESGARGKFIMDPITGVISVRPGANLDPDLTEPRTALYKMEIFAVDGGIGDSQLRGVTIVEIHIRDVNNKSPVFKKLSPSPILVPENVNPGYFVAKLEASDQDLDANLQYSLALNVSEVITDNGRTLSLEDLEESQGLRPFEIDKNNGDLRVVGTIDREVFRSVNLVAIVKDLNAKVNGEPQLDTIYIKIQIEDQNDNNPEFDEPSYFATVAENSDPGIGILHVQARDIDDNDTVSFEIEGPSDIIQFVDIDSKSGEIFVGGGKIIDHEAMHWLNFSVKATDSGVPRLSTVVPVSIRILDVNDNSPEFKNSMATIDVSEATAPGSIVARLTAEDADSGEFGKITYFLDRQTTSSGEFQIHPETGELTVMTALDRESKDLYSFIVQAYDNYQFGFSTGDSRVGFLQVNLRVTDVNDEAPIFLSDKTSRKTDSSCTFINEFHDILDPIVTIRASDPDDTLTENGKISQDLFRLETAGSGSANIFPNKRLKGFYGNYSLEIEARDHGSPQNRITKSFQICVQDFNDNPPKFVYPSSNMTIRIFENTTVGTDIITVRAIDSDIGRNGEIRFSLRPDPQGNHKTFDIDPIKGTLTLAQPLDRERQKLFDLRIEAKDLGIPTPLQTDLDLQIYVKNINDNEPLFPVDEITVNFTEHKSPGAESIILVEAFDRDDDYEDEDGIKVCYFIVEGNEFNTFHLHPEKRELTLNRELDRELQSEYLLTVEATEECFLTSLETKGFDPNNDSLLRVRVKVNDIDDNPPKFVKNTFTGGISTDIDFGATILTLEAKDEDVDANANLQYSLDGRVLASGNSENIENIRQPPFLIDGQTGELKLNFDPLKSMKGYFDFTVRVADAAGHVDKAKVQIYLLREDQRVKFVMRSHPSEIRDRIDKFRSAMADTTNSIANVDFFRVHENMDGSIDKSKTDLYMHFVDPANNSVMEVNDILKRIDYKIEELDDLFRDFNVLDTEGVHQAEARSAAAVSIANTSVLLWLIAICIGLFLLLACVLAVCLHQRSRYRRKIRAATTVAYGDPASVESSILNRKELVPNTNRHASEGSNPIWMTGVAYDNLNVDMNEDDEMEEHPRSRSYELSDEPLDSLDANILNESFQKADSSHEANGSTLRISSKTVMDSTRSRSSSSGLGSAGIPNDQVFRTGPNGGLYRKSSAISSLFPPHMRPVEKLFNGDEEPRTNL